jgi:hypothetical protein
MSRLSKGRVLSCDPQRPFVLSVCTRTPENAFIHELVTPCSIFRGHTPLFATMHHCA